MREYLILSLIWAAVTGFVAYKSVEAFQTATRQITSINQVDME